MGNTTEEMDRFRAGIDKPNMSDYSGPGYEKYPTDVENQYHYQGDIQPIQFMCSIMQPLAFEGYLQGNVIKYISRYQKKNGMEDLHKAKVYQAWLTEFLLTGTITVKTTTSA